MKETPVLGFFESGSPLPPVGGQGTIRLVVDFLCPGPKFLMPDLPRATYSGSVSELSLGTVTGMHWEEREEASLPEVTG